MDQNEINFDKFLNNNYQTNAALVFSELLMASGAQSILLSELLKKIIALEKRVAGETVDTSMVAEEVTQILKVVSLAAVRHHTETLAEMYKKSP